MERSLIEKVFAIINNFVLYNQVIVEYIYIAQVIKS